MTPVTRAELRRDLSALVACAELPGAFTGPAEVVHDQILVNAYRSWAVGLCVPFDTEDESLRAPPPLTPFQQMCLSGLLGDPAQLEAAVVDCALDMGIDAVTAAYERGKAEERHRILSPLIQAADQREDSGWFFRITAELVSPSGK